MRKLFLILILFSTPLFINAQQNDVSLGAQYTWFPTKTRWIF